MCYKGSFNYAPPPEYGLKNFVFDLQRFADLTLSQDSGYYLIGSVSDLQALAAYVNDGGDTSGLEFKLTADISGVDFHIGTADNAFKGTFDGGGNKITVNYNSTTENCALFNFVDGATVKQLTVDGTINTSAKCAAGIAAQANGSCYIQNCTSSVTINSTVSGDRHNQRQN